MKRIISFLYMVICLTSFLMGQIKLDSTLQTQIQNPILEKTLTDNPVDDYSVTLDLKVFMEGPFFSYQMTPFINVLGFLPTSQPYNASPWVYEGTESVPIIPSFNIIDWILVEILEPNLTEAEGFMIVDRKACFVLNNGKITELDGLSNITMISPDTTGFYIKINHRNHISIISSDSLQKSSGVYSWDFTSGSGQVIGEEHSQNELIPGVWGMICGDGDGNSQVDNRDKNDVWVVEQNSFGYFAGDYDMDCQVTEDDIIVKWAPNTGKGFK